MNIRTLQRGLKYRGLVKAVRQTYYVFEAHGYFFVLSFALSKARRGSGYFNVISADAPDGQLLERKSQSSRSGATKLAVSGRPRRKKLGIARRPVGATRTAMVRITSAESAT